MASTRPLDIGWAMLARPQAEGQLPGQTIELLVFQPPGSTTLPDTLFLDLHFTEGLGCEAWRETQRCPSQSGVTTLTLEPSRLPALGCALLQTGTNLEHIERIVVRGGEDFSLELRPRPHDLRFSPHDSATP